MVAGHRRAGTQPIVISASTTPTESAHATLQVGTASHKLIWKAHIHPPRPGKYLVDDVLRPKCNTDIHVVLIDTKSAHPIARHLAPAVVNCQATLLDGPAYDERETPHEVAITRNKEGNPLLMQLPRREDEASSPESVSFQLSQGRGRLPDIVVTASSEAMLQGRKPPFRLWVQALAQPTWPPILDAISEPFVVATRRVKSAAKLDTPLVDDPAGKLHHLGKETVRRLADLPAAAVEFGVPLPPLPISHVRTVGDFQTLCQLADADESLQHLLLSLVKLSSNKWVEARDHALTAVQRDDRPRVWVVVEGRSALLYTCHRGQIAMDAPAAILLPAPRGALRDTGLPPGAPWQPVRRGAWDGAQRAMAEAAHEQARSSWKRPGHPGWRALDGCDGHALNSWLHPMQRRGGRAGMVLLAGYRTCAAMGSAHLF